MANNINKLAKIFKALSDKNRLKILILIQQNECRCECQKDEKKYSDASCIRDITKSIKISAPTISHHIKELIGANLIKVNKIGKYIYCKINKESINQINNLLNNLK